LIFSAFLNRGCISEYFNRSGNIPVDNILLNIYVNGDNMKGALNCHRIQKALRQLNRQNKIQWITHNSLRWDFSWYYCNILYILCILVHRSTFEVRKKSSKNRWSSYTCSIECESEFLPLKELHLLVLMNINNTPKTNFICLCNKEIYCTFQSCCMISILFFTKCCW